MKKTLTILLAFVLVIAISVAGTYAYLTSTAEVKNTFTLGEVKISLDETDITKDTGDHTVRTEVGNTYTGLYPGQSVVKDPIVHNNGKNPAYIRMCVVIDNWYNTYNKVFPDAKDPDETFGLLFGELGAGWTYVESGFCNTPGGFGVSFVLKYDSPLEKGTDTSAAFQTFTVPSSLNNEGNVGGTPIGIPDVTVTADAVQAEGFENYDAAFAAFDAQAAK